MYKFVVVKNSKLSCRQEVTSMLAQVRMSGYLKKKRKKMGGWRKLWFVLQNQLLLSYSSKEDYEKRLAPFKDVVNLGPGTIVRPTKGPRFIIETSTNLIYTFRCDDNKACSEWITALVDSLSLSVKITRDSQLKNQNKSYFSLDNLPQPQCKQPIKASRSWDSICKSVSKSPNLPIAHSTARILERNGSSEGGINLINSRTERVRNFRLHQNDLKMNQSHEVHRINRMFSRCDLVKNDIDATNINYCQTDFNQNNRRNMEMLGNCSIEEQIHRLSLVDEQQSSIELNSTKNSINISPSASSYKHIENIIGKNKLASTPSKANINEPIYAVVDLKNKYARRAKIKEHEDRVEHERPKSLQVLSSDYEEVLQYCNGMPYHDNENENIYEPINIPEYSPKNPMWRYFSKINIDALVEITKKKKNAKDEPSAFYDIRKRWGNHRKSIKNRVKKFYGKDPKEAQSNGRSFSDNDLGSQDAACSITDSTKSIESCMEKGSFVMSEIDKYRKGEKHIFGSLGRLRKSRTSLCLEEMSPSKKLIISENTDFQKELKREISKRSSDKKQLQCHSKFYD